MSPDQAAVHNDRATRPVYALFQRRLPGDDALLKLARLRFAQFGLAAELYADTPDELEYILQFVPPHPCLPVVHLDRNVNVLHERGRAVVEAFADRFASRIAGLVVHDSPEMGVQTDRLVAALHQLNTRLCRWPTGPVMFLEYAASLEPSWFAGVAERLQDAERISFCVDVGHIGIRQAFVRFDRSHPGLHLVNLTAGADRLPSLVADVQEAVRSALPDVLEVTRAIGRLGKRVHFHLHDGHPLVRGISDHFSFLTRLPIPFSFEGCCSLSMMYGPALGGHCVDCRRCVWYTGSVLHTGDPSGGRSNAPGRRHGDL